MPVFILPIGERPSAPKTFAALDYFTRGYVEAMFWTEMEHGTDSESHDPEHHSTLPGDVTFADLASEALTAIIADCEAFQRDHAELLQRAYERREDYDDERAGHDFWLTRNRHGAGFWDRGLGSVGVDLTRAAHGDGEAYVYIGDDGLIYV